MMSIAEEVKAANGHQLRADIKRTSTPSTSPPRSEADGHTGRDVHECLGVSRAQRFYRYLTEDIAV